MFKNYLVTAWRNIVKNGMFSALNIFGLAIGLMSCILIMLFVRSETGFDNWLPENDRLVRLHSAFHMPGREPFLSVRSAGRMMEAIRDYASNEIETGVRFIQWPLTVRQNENVFSEKVTMVDGSFFDVFKLPFTHGNSSTSFNKPLDFLITERLALKYFGKTDVIGETLTLCCLSDTPSDVVITGVLADFPENTHLNTEMIAYLQPALFGENNGILDSWTNLNVYTYFKLNAGVNLEDVQQRIDYWMNNESPLVEMMKQFLGEKAIGKKVTDFANQKLMPLTDIHLYARKHAGNQGDLTPMGDIEVINTFSIVAILVLVIACINFINLSTAKASKRAKEVAMRKVLGATRTQVAIQFLLEAITLVFIALLIALVAVELILPLYNQVLGKNLELHLFTTPGLLLVLIALALLVGIGAGLYPALYLSRFLPGHILKASKSAEAGSSTKLRTFLVVFQFTTSIVLVIATLVVYGQTIFANSVDLGYQSNNKLILNIESAGDNLASLKQELLNLPEITSVVYSSEAPSQDRENNDQFKLLETLPGGGANEPLIINYHDMDYGFFEAYQVKPIAGRLFDQNYGTDTYIPVEDGEDRVGTASAILNESALTKLGFKSPEEAIGKTLAFRKHHLTIIGVIPNLYFRSIKFGIRASVYKLTPSRFRVASLSFNTNDLSSLLTKVARVWKNNVPMEPINVQFLSEMMKAQYDNELTTAQLFLVFSVLAIIVACLGLFGLSAFTVERRTKEIGIRKVMGANVTDIVRLLIWQFSKPVVIANFIAWPIAGYMMLSWLEAFPYRIDNLVLLPIFLSVSILSLLIAWITVGTNTTKVARKNPIHALRYE
ncbi:ABC transporter permease [Thalassotalea insulae]|uniref:ABC transporter permease n=2 Tax=Thalassotalea insulae TaxID=2056778 RepID=A0ABQ6GM80_9GAMM|nr:ABC transporter permease [Thalassotalea insulae]